MRYQKIEQEIELKQMVNHEEHVTMMLIMMMITIITSNLKRQ